jgi:hypothetical protein
MTDNALVPVTALDRLKKTAEFSSADDFVAASGKRSLLLLDCSSSMGGRIRTGERRIDKLRNIVDELRTTHHVPLAAFGPFGQGTELVETVPEPSGMTPLHRAIEYGRMAEANHLIVVTDGIPDSKTQALAEARAFGHPIDVFYIGDGNDEGAQFCAELARVTGGKSGVTDLVGSPKQLAGKLAGLLGDGSF